MQRWPGHLGSCYTNDIANAFIWLEEMLKVVKSRFYRGLFRAVEKNLGIILFDITRGVKTIFRKKSVQIKSWLKNFSQSCQSAASESINILNLTTIQNIKFLTSIVSQKSQFYNIFSLFHPLGFSTDITHVRAEMVASILPLLFLNLFWISGSLQPKQKYKIKCYFFIK